MFNVFVTQKIPESGVLLLRKTCNVEIHDHNHALPRAELLSAVKGRQGLLTLLTDTIDAAVMDAAGPELKVISNYAVGVNNIDIKEAKRRGIVVTNTPGVLTESCADLTFALILGIARRIVEGDALTRAGKFEGWDPMLLLGGDVHGKTLGIVGYGRIGQAVAKRASGFNMKILATPHGIGDTPGTPLGQSRDCPRGVPRFVPLDMLISESDFVSLHVPLTPETTHLIGESELRKMKPSAYLINTSRGPVVDEALLAKALKEKWIAGAALDVYEHEPKINPDLLKLTNVILEPHIASATFETRSEMSVIAAKNLLAVLQGKPPLHAVSP